MSTSACTNTLVAGIGNIFMGDDAFGCEVAQRLSQRGLPAGIGTQQVDIVDFGIRGMDLGYALADGYQLIILIDAAQRGGSPGTVYVIEPEIDDSAANAAEPEEPLIAPHGMGPAQVLRSVAALGERRPRILLVACEPAYLGGDDGYMGLSEAVAAACEQAVTEIATILRDWSSSGHAYCVGGEIGITNRGAWPRGA